MGTEADFAAALDRALGVAREKHRLHFPALQWMIDVYGGLEAARNFLNADRPSKAFRELAARGLSELSVEALALEPRFEHLFTAEQLQTARARLSS